MSNGTLGTPAGNGHPLSKQQIFDLIKQKIPYKEICRQSGFSKGYISQLKKEMEFHDKKELVMVEFKDHAHAINSFQIDIKHLPILRAVGYIVQETPEAILLAQTWSEIIEKTIQSQLILRPAIVKVIPLSSSLE